MTGLRRSTKIRNKLASREINSADCKVVYIIQYSPIKYIYLSIQNDGYYDIISSINFLEFFYQLSFKSIMIF